ncbi:hypothetical protein DID88_007685 [Monilinia fructigena]|uniref:Uncharacterized protein n=1 Tax=Monilinia fructigena TaxID=38457 RepID=A0A395J5F4_9HELO|nr:hypothetical protein DID88_007685 [Monilinia fructigena]
MEDIDRDPRVSAAYTARLDQTLQDLQERVKEQRSLARKIHAFNTFITTHLAPKLAAEELGGPIVGQLQSITPQTLTAGFTTQGKPKTSRLNSTPDPTTRQRRIDESGPCSCFFPSETGGENEEPSAPKLPRNETQAAATELRALTEQLLNALFEAETEGKWIGRRVRDAREGQRGR